MSEATISEAAEPSPPEIEHHEYHSAVEVDENYNNWRDWVGPGAAILFLIGALVVIAMMITGNI